MTQRKKLANLLIEFCNQKESRTFSLQELHREYGDYSNIQIGGKTPQATVRRLLQELRDDGFVSFLDKSGHYTLRGIDLLEVEKLDLKSIDISQEAPQKKEYLFEVYVRNAKWVKQAKHILGEFCLCKDCQNTFIMEDGSRYIEVHHIIPLSEGGEDGIWNLAVLCAHHHRFAHFANTTEKIRLEQYLLKEVACRL